MSVSITLGHFSCLQKITRVEIFDYNVVNLNNESKSFEAINIDKSEQVVWALQKQKMRKNGCKGYQVDESGFDHIQLHIKYCEKTEANLFLYLVESCKGGTS